MKYLLLFLFMTSAYAETYSCKTQMGTLDIPYVETESLEEFYYCFGLHHGKDRAWEMDYFRRVGEGRNAEIYGFSHLKSDLMMKLLDLPHVAADIWNKFSPEKRKWLELYAEGANEGFKTGKNAQEFKDKDYEPEPWQPQHTILVLLLQSFDQTRKTFFRDYEEEKTKGTWGEKAESLFDEDNMPWENTILKDGEYKKQKVELKKTSYSWTQVKFWSQFPEVFGDLESGSNNWAVSAKKSKTGKAVFANDPHLDLKTPLFWYWISLKSPEARVIGASVPGVPVIASGTNGKVAWGLTNSYLNSADVVFVDDIKDEDIVKIRPTVKVKFLFFHFPFFLKSFEELKTGEKVLPLEVDGDHKLVLRWTGFKLSPEDFYPMFELFNVNNVSEMDEVTSKIGVPSWNFSFADTKGDIGFRVVGKTYQSGRKSPFGIPTMSYKEFSEAEILSPEDQPHVLKPKRQYVYSANNRHWPLDGEFYGGRGYSYSFRGFRIDELLGQGKQNIESFKKIQCDVQAVDARFFKERIQRHLHVPEFENWDFMAYDESKVLPLYRRLMDLMMERWEVNEYALYKILGDLDATRLDQMKKMLTIAKEEVGDRTWGEIHRINFPHLSKNSDWDFSPELAGVGDTHSVNPGTSKWNPDKKIYEHYSGASMRMIIEMDTVPKIYLNLPGLNRDYENKPAFSPWLDWKKCQYQEVKF